MADLMSIAHGADGRTFVGLGWDAEHPMEPTAGTWHPVPTPRPQAYIAPPPPANDSPQTRAELAELHRLARVARGPADVAQVLRWSTDEPTPLTHWGRLADRLAGRYQLSVPAGARLHALLADGIYNALIACWQSKYLYRRPRPSMLDPTLTTVIPVPPHPSYPSGHACAAGAANRILSQFFPQDAAVVQAMAVDSVMSRMKAGIHFLSDQTAGVILGRQVADDILAAEAHTGEPMSYHHGG